MPELATEQLFVKADSTVQHDGGTALPYCSNYRPSTTLLQLKAGQDAGLGQLSTAFGLCGDQVLWEMYSIDGAVQ